MILGVQLHIVRSNQQWSWTNWNSLGRILRAKRSCQL